MCWNYEINGDALSSSLNQEYPFSFKSGWNNLMNLMMAEYSNKRSNG